jgi:hypothetical protein
MVIRAVRTLRRSNPQKGQVSYPTNKQLTDFACALIYGPGAGDEVKRIVETMLEMYPDMRRIWRERYAHYQQVIEDLTKLYLEE